MQAGVARRIGGVVEAETLERLPLGSVVRVVCRRAAADLHIDGLAIVVDRSFTDPPEIRLRLLER